MKATGIVRRMDDLGRIVLPKEIRRTMRIKEGDPLEIFLDKDNNCIALKRYFPYDDEVAALIPQIVENMFTDVALLGADGECVMSCGALRGTTNLNQCEEDDRFVVEINVDGERIGYLATVKEDIHQVKQLNNAVNVIKVIVNK